MKAVNVGICGLGTVGSGTFNVLARNATEINARAGHDIKVSHVGARRDNPACDLSGITVLRDVLAVCEVPEVDIIVETIGGCDIAKEVVLKAISNGKHVVTANKALIALHGNEIFAAAEAKGVAVYYEAAVAGGVPIIKAVREGLAANKIQWLAGIINGTGNFILTEMRDKGRAFDDVLAEAQELGYAEADPTFDVEGIDACHKLVILASLAFGIPLQFEKAYTEGISNIAQEDVIYAEELGYRIKHLGIAKRVEAGVELRVHPTLIPEKRLIANVDGVMNAVLVNADAVGSTLYYGAGAGSEPTASSVIADIVDVARLMDVEKEQRVPALAFHPGHLDVDDVLPIEEIETAYYMRLSAKDEPGVMSSITQILSDNGVSIEALIQKPVAADQDYAVVIILTNVVKEKAFNTALASIESLAAVAGSVNRIRVESLG
ncbi:MAG: homoserine dehydrogenase [Pseudomonadales bacterium]|nr:homoserine dehydrogenase [Pseudomonadales bacterium]